jgi:trimeric autotransporter adhesin
MGINFVPAQVASVASETEPGGTTMTLFRQHILHSTSILAICIAAPAAAQTTTINGGVLLPNPLTTLPADTNAGGVTATGEDATARVDNLSNGEAAQVSETATPVALTNGGTMTVTASATGTGDATAVVGNIAPDVIATGAYQSAITQRHQLGDVEGATWNASATLINTGTTRVRAIASSSDGDATARVIGGIAQVASVETKGRSATAVMDNRATIEVSAAASGSDTILASVGTGGETGAPAIRQFVFSSKSPTATTSGSGSILNSGTMTVSASASPLVAGAPSALASITGGVVQQVQATGRGNSNLLATVTNSNAMTFSSTAGIGAGTALSSTAFATEVLTQRVQANGGGLASDPVTGWNDIATVTMSNSGTISLTTNARAVEAATSLVGVKAIPADPGQYANLYPNSYGPNGVGTGTDNSYQLFGDLSPIISEHGVISQRAQANGWGDDVTDVNFTNSVTGNINILAGATALNPAGSAIARNAAAGFVVQKTQANGTGNDTSRATATNLGRIALTADATSTATGGDAMAVSSITGGIQQVGEVTGPTKFALPASGEGGSGSSGGGEPTFGFYTNIGELTFVNGATGTVDVRVNARATATGGGGEAHAYVEPAVLQTIQVDGGTPRATFDNRNSFNVAVSSVASGTGAFATAGAGDLLLDVGFPVEEGRLPTEHYVIGVGQFLLGKASDARFTNSGDFTVSATSTATGSTEGALSIASVIGYGVTGEPVGITVTNSRNMTVSATATASGNAGTSRVAEASAVGMGFYANYEPLPELPDIVHGGDGKSEHGGSGDHPGGDEEEEAEAPTYRLSGTVTNTGTLSVTARATGDAQLPAVTPTLPASIVPDQTLSIGATAVGIDFEAAANTVTLQNRGTIDATSITNGAPSAAIGILVRDYENVWGVQSAAGDVVTLNNLGGTIRARVSTNGGTSFTRGTAIDTSNAPNQVIINLEAGNGTNGFIYGNIDLSADDAIRVRNGETVFDGVVNRGGPAEGSLTIQSGGTLYLVNQPHGAVSTTGTATVNPAYSGPAGAVVNAFAVDSGGKLALQMPILPTGPGTYPTVVANTVTLGANSALEVRRSSWNGLYANSYTFNNVIKAPNAAALSGTFAASQVTMTQPTPLLTVQALYNQDTGGGDVDIRISRVGFGSVAGLTANQTATGNGIEQVYLPTLTGPFANLLGNLFLLNSTDYSNALTQLSGEQYAGFAQALRNQGMQINSVVANELDCSLARQGLAECVQRDGQIRLWGRAHYNDVEVDSDANAAGYDANSWSGLFGLNYSTGSFTFGAFGGYRDTKYDSVRNGGRIDADGWQMGLMAAYDTGNFYGRIVGSHASLDGTASRTVNVLTTTGTITAEPDARITSIYGEVGGRLELGRAIVTPFLAIDHANVRLNGFAETGVPGANLAFGKQSENQTSMLAGVRLAGNFNGVVPEVQLAWRNDFGNRQIGVDASFADGPAGSLHRLTAPTIDRSSVVAGASLGAALGGRVTGRIGYQGRFAGQANDHALYGSLSVRF